MQYEPIPCKQCSAILNFYARVDFYSKVWMCPFCHSRNHFPPHYQGISESNLPAELYSNYCTIEYTMARTVQPHAPVYLFVIDTCVLEDELVACKAAITQSIQALPEYANVGLITFGTHVHVYELGFTECSKCYVFRGSKEYTTQQIVEQLGVRPPQRAGPGVAPAAAVPARKFLVPLSEGEFTLTTALEELQKDSYPVISTHRPARCTGAALQVWCACACGVGGGGAAGVCACACGLGLGRDGGSGAAGVVCMWSVG